MPFCRKLHVFVRKLQQRAESNRMYRILSIEDDPEQEAFP